MTILSKSVLLLLGVLSCFLAVAQEPSYEEVLSYLHTNVTVNPLSGSFEISKKPNGFYICTRFYDEGGASTVEDCQQFWTSSTQQFVYPSFEEGEKYTLNEERTLTTRFSRLWSERLRAGRMLYYGYADWTADTKAILEQKKTLTSEELELLARVYFDEANEFIHPGQYGLSGSSDAGFKDAGYEKISRDRVIGFKQAFDKSLSAWEKIRKQDPKYSPSIIVDLDLKIANEYMHGWLTMNCILEPELGNDYLERAFYPPSFVEYAKSILNDCDQNSFLLTSGDSDTYPIWYVQEKLGYRTDVKIINTSLAQTVWYQEYVLDRFKLNKRFTDEELRANQRSYFVFTSEESISFNDWLNQFHSEKPDMRDDGTYDAPYITVDGQWTLDRGENSVLLSRQSYIYGSVAFFFDIITSNPDLGVFGTSWHAFKDLGIEKYASYRGSSVKMESFIPDSYFTKDSEAALIKNISALSNDYFVGLGNWSGVQSSLTLSFATSLPKSYTNQAITLIDSKIVNKLKIEMIQPNLALALCDFYEKFDESKYNAFRSKYETTAIGIINDFKIVPSSLYDDLDELSDIISIYTGISSREMESYVIESDLPWNGSKTLLATLKKKLYEIERLCEKRKLSVSLISVRHTLNTLLAIRD